MLIKQPKDMSVTTANGRLDLRFSKNFASARSENFQKAQKFIDSECIRLMAPYTPMQSGILMKSATIGTKIGSGEIRQATPYARYMYYGVVYGPNVPMYENGELIGFWSPPKKYPTSRQITYSTAKHPQAGKQWFERMKEDKKPIILRGAAQILGGRIR